MSKLFFVFTFFISLISNAISCIHPSAGLSLTTSIREGNIYVRIVAGRGYESLPQIEGPLSQNDLGVARFQTDYLKKLGDVIEFQMPLSACDLDKAHQGIFSCYKESEIKGSLFKVLSLTAYTVKQSHVSGDFELQNFRMLLGDENLFFVGTSFAKTHCNFKSLTKTKF